MLNRVAIYADGCRHHLSADGEARTCGRMTVLG